MLATRPQNPSISSHDAAKESNSKPGLLGPASFEGWILLAHIEEDRHIPNLLIGDAGKLYFVMPDDDIRQRRFDRVMWIMQCH